MAAERGTYIERGVELTGQPITSHFSGGRRLDAGTAILLEHAATYERERAWEQSQAPQKQSQTAESPAGADVERAYGTAALTLNGVTVEQNGAPVLDRFDLTVPAGGIAVVLGLTGLAKGALVETILARRLPEAGQVRVLGNDPRQLPLGERHDLGLDVGVVLRGSGLFSSMSLADNAAFVMRNEIGLEDKQIVPRVNAALALVGLTEIAHMLPEDISVGHRKRAAFARALASEPQLIVFDEPEAGYDDTRTALFGELIAHVHEQRGGAYLVLTQSLRVLRGLATHAVLVHRGHAVAAGSPQALAASSNPHVRQLMASPGSAGTLQPTTPTG